MDKPTFFMFPYLAAQTHQLGQQLDRTLRDSKNPEVRSLVDQLPHLAGDPTGADETGQPPLTVAFAGQYNAGKSTLIRALTGQEVVIHADVCTEQVTAYEWNSVRLLDTPGIGAGHEDHDRTAYEAIDRTDLLVFVITGHLFDNQTGQHFRQLAFERGKAGEMMLVVNKMDMDSGRPEDKRADIEKVTNPWTCEDFRTVFIDAKMYLEALEEQNADERQELMELARFQDLVDALNRFVGERGLVGRLTTPLFTLRSVAADAEAHVSVDQPEEQTALELLRRRRRILRESRTNLRRTLEGLIDRASADVVRCGDEFVDEIVPGVKKDQLQHKRKQIKKRIKKRDDDLRQQVSSAIEEEVARLEKELSDLGACELAEHLQSQLQGPVSTSEEGADAKNSPASAADLEVSAIPSDPVLASRAQKVAEVSSRIGTLAARWSTGPWAEGARVGSATAARGSKAHEMVTAVGHFFNVRFKPWGAVRLAKYLGNTGLVLSVLAPVIAVLGQAMNEVQDNHQQKKIQEARDEARSAYRGMAGEMERMLRTQVDAWLREFYGHEEQAVDGQMAGLTGRRQTRSEEAKRFQDLREEAGRLIQAAHRLEIASQR